MALSEGTVSSNSKSSLRCMDKVGPGCRFVMAWSYPLCSGEIFLWFSMRWRCLRCYHQDSLLLLHCMCSCCSLAKCLLHSDLWQLVHRAPGWHVCARYSLSFPAGSGGTAWSRGRAWMSRLDENLFVWWYKRIQLQIVKMWCCSEVVVSWAMCHWATL